MNLMLMPLHIRHLEKKLIIYGFLLAIFITISVFIINRGMGVETIVFLSAGVLCLYFFAYLLFDPIALWICNARMIGETEEPGIFQIADTLRKQRGIRMPKLAILNGPITDVYIVGRDRNHTILFFSRAFLTKYNDIEREIILKNEFQSIEELGLFAYNVITMSLTSLMTAARHIKLRHRLKSHIVVDPGNTTVTISRPNISDVPVMVKLLIANDMYNYFNLHSLNRLVLEASPLLLMAYCDGKPVGFAIGEINTSGRRIRGRLCKFIVEESYRGKGIGHRMMRYFIEAFESMGCLDCSLEVRVDNKKAISLYEKHGFQKERTIPMYYPDGTDCLIMVKS